MTVSSLFLLRNDSFQLRLQLLIRSLQEVDFLGVVLLVRELLLRGPLLDHLARPLQVGHLLLKSGLVLLEPAYRRLHVRLALQRNSFELRHGAEVVG